MRLMLLCAWIFILCFSGTAAAQSQASEADAVGAGSADTIQNLLADARLTDEERYTSVREVLHQQGADAVTLRAVDGFLRLLTPERLETDRDLASEAFLRIISSIGRATSDAELQIQRRHVARLLPLLSDADAVHVIREDRSTDADGWTFWSGAGAFLETWWRRNDPLPGTEENERLNEHLHRVAVATSRYACESRTGGIDDRGTVFIRYGEPGRSDVVEYNSMDFQLDVFRFGVPVTQNEFPENELWSYTRIDDSAYFIFTENARQCYEVGGALDLVPSRLIQVRGRSERAENIAYSGMMALRYIYQELSLFHIDFSSVYSQIETYVSFQEEEATRAELGEAFGTAIGSGGTQTRTVGAGLNQTRRVSSSSNFGIPSPSGFIPSVATQIEQEDRASAHRRKKRLPRQVTDLMTSEELIPVAVQTVRFLNPDGTTRIEMAWGLQNQHLLPLDSDAEARPSILIIDAVQFDTEYQRVDQVEQKYTIQPSSLVEQDLFVSPPLVFDDMRDLAHIGIQWRQFDIEGRLSEDATVGEQMRVATVRSDSLRPLHASGKRLEVSDVQSMVSPSGVVDDAVAFPFASLNPDTPLVLYFEVYHLAYGDNDQTRYTVAYDVERRAPKGWRRLFGSEDIEKTTTEMTYSGTERRTEEFISIDLSTLRQPKTQELRVTVRVTDTITGETVARVKRIQLVGTDEL